MTCAPLSSFESLLKWEPPTQVSRQPSRLLRNPGFVDGIKTVDSYFQNLALLGVGVERPR